MVIELVVSRNVQDTGVDETVCGPPDPARSDIQVARDEDDVGFDIGHVEITKLQVEIAQDVDAHVAMAVPRDPWLNGACPITDGRACGGVAVRPSSIAPLGVFLLPEPDAVVRIHHARGHVLQVRAHALEVAQVDRDGRRVTRAAGQHLAGA